MINVDGVIAGNYRTSMSGNDLNRRYLEPNPRLHPEVSSVKNLIHKLVFGSSGNDGFGNVADSQAEDVIAFVDMHGHSRKKNTFIYGPQFALSSEKYYRTRLIPKLLSEETSKFRFHSCQFKNEPEKRKTARIVFARDYGVQNCYTLEASFHGHFDEERCNYEFTHESFEEMGQHLVNSFYEYILILEEEQRLKHLKDLDKKKKKKKMQQAQSQTAGEKLKAKKKAEKL